MDRHSLGLGTASLAFLCFLGGPAAPQDLPKRSPGVAQIDGAVRQIKGTTPAAQSPRPMTASSSAASCSISSGSPRAARR
jgi:hypothetical protein